jgi:hypothetical protein
MEIFAFADKSAVFNKYRNEPRIFLSEIPDWILQISGITSCYLMKKYLSLTLNNF